MRINQRRTVLIVQTEPIIAIEDVLMCEKYRTYNKIVLDALRV